MSVVVAVLIELGADAVLRRRLDARRVRAEAWSSVHVDDRGRRCGASIRLDDDGLHLLDADGALVDTFGRRELRHVGVGRKLLRGPLLMGVEVLAEAGLAASLWIGADSGSRHAFAMREGAAREAAVTIARRFGATPFPPPPPRPREAARTPAQRLAAVLRPARDP